MGRGRRRAAWKWMLVSCSRCLLLNIVQSFSLYVPTKDWKVVTFALCCVRPMPCDLRVDIDGLYTDTVPG